MRDPNRLDNFYDEMKKLHMETYPDWRWGQLIHNFFSWLMEKYKIDGFYAEEDKMMQWFKEFCEGK